MKAIILVGGLGSRLRPYTDHTPKPLLPVGGKPILEVAIDNLAKHGVEEVILAVGYKADKIKEQFGDGERHGIKISYNLEEEGKLLGTGGAIKDVVTKFQLKEPFLVVWGDNLANFDITKLKNHHEEQSTPVSMILTTREDVENFGVASLNGNIIEGFVEKPKREEAPSKLINAGAFIIHPQALDILPEGKSSMEYDCFEKLAPQGKLSAFIHEGFWLPTDTVEKYEHANNVIPGLLKN